MRDHAGVLTDELPDPRVVLFRRAAITVGFLFGFVLLALITAGQARAEEAPTAEQQDRSVAEPITESVADVTAPVTDLVGGLVAPVVEPVAETAAPVVRPVVESVAPVVRPVTERVLPVLEPVVDTVAPVLEAAEPVVDPVTEAVGAQDVVSGLEGEQSSPERTERPAPAPPQAPPAPAAPAPVTEVETVTVPQQATPVADPPRHSAAPADPSGPGDNPGSPAWPNAVTGGGTASGSGGQHGADSTAPTFGPSSTVDRQDDRAPPGTKIALPWLAFDSPDHPS